MDTIVAISTATGKGGIGIIRMSGDTSFKIIKKIFKSKTENQIVGYRMQYGNIIDNKGNVIDEVLVSFFTNPKSYTKEDMCEINSHGGYAVEKAILEECIKNGARLAEPGEFTKRAFLNGRIDLSQAEAVIDLINSKTEIERKASVNQLEGVLSTRIREIQKELLELMADIEVNIDYPEYDVEDVTSEKIRKTLKDVKEKLSNLNDSYKNGKIIKEGIRTAIIGKPNVGKSSLLNLMLNEDRAIVSNIEGTTRDTIEESININGIQLKIVDTAGIRTTIDEIEKIGVNKSINVIGGSDLIFAIFDNSRAFDEEDKNILELIKNKRAIIIINKTDIKEEKLKDEEIEKSKHPVVKISTKTGEGIKDLYNQVSTMFDLNNLDTNNGELITNLRQKQHIEKSLEEITEVEDSLSKNMTMDVISTQIKIILEEIGNITGETVSENIINKIFSKFCLGK